MGAMSNLDVILQDGERQIEDAASRLLSVYLATEGTLSAELRARFRASFDDLYDAGIDTVLELRRTITVDEPDEDPWSIVRDLTSQLAALTAATLHNNPIPDNEEPLDLDNLSEPTGQTLEVIMGTGEVFQIEDVDGFVLKLDSGEWPVGWMFEDEPEDNPKTVRKAGYWDESGEWHAFDTRYRNPRTQGMF